MKKYISTRHVPYFVVAGASVVMLIIILSGQLGFPYFPLILFISAKLSLLFGAAELGLSYIGKYEEKEAVHDSIMRAISAFGMAACFILLVGAYEAAKA